MIKMFDVVALLNPIPNNRLTLVEPEYQSIKGDLKAIASFSNHTLMEQRQKSLYLLFYSLFPKTNQ